MPLHPADRKMFHTYLRDVDALALNLNDTAANIKDRELSRHLEKLAADILYVTTDMNDTVNRI